MSIFGLFKRGGSAPVARERLQLLLSYERAAGSQLDLVTVLREEILNALTKHIRLEPDNVRVKMDRGDTVSTLAVDIEIPNGVNGLLSARS